MRKQSCERITATDQMPDFEVNEGYLQASARRRDPSLPAVADDGIFSGRRVAPYGLDVASEYAFEDVLSEGFVDGLLGEGTGPRADELWGEGLGLDGLISPGLQPKLPAQTPIVRRTRHLAGGHRTAAATTTTGEGRRVGVKLVARRRLLARRACPCGLRARIMSTPPRHRRRLWTSCHGQPRQTPGSLS